MSIKITGLQQVQDALEKELKKLTGDSYALVGIHESAGMIEDGTMTQAQLGAIQHFGTNDGHIPARPFLDVGVASGNDEYLEIIKEGIAAGLTAKQIIDRVGASAAGMVRQYMTDLKDPPNAPSTIAKKGSANPLIDTGSLRGSITHTVVNRKPEFGL